MLRPPRVIVGIEYLIVSSAPGTLRWATSRIRRNTPWVSGRSPSRYSSTVVGVVATGSSSASDPDPATLRPGRKAPWTGAFAHGGAGWARILGGMFGRSSGARRRVRRPARWTVVLLATLLVAGCTTGGGDSSSDDSPLGAD